MRISQGIPPRPQKLVFFGELPPQPDHITANVSGNLTVLPSCMKTPLKRCSMGIATGSAAITVDTAVSNIPCKNLAASGVNPYNRHQEDRRSK